MNYFAHGHPYVDDPWFLLGTAVPDLLNVADRGVRVRSKHAATWCDDADPRVAAIARGIVRHHADDAWFHETRAFSDLSLDFTVRVRDALGNDAGFRPSFLGHILVELLLDAALMAEDPARMTAYYAAWESVDPSVVESAVNRMAARPTERLTYVVGMFARERFLWDYADDGRLWFRLNQVMRRVGLPQLPREVSHLFASARQAVAARRDCLLAERVAAATHHAHPPSRSLS